MATLDVEDEHLDLFPTHVLRRRFRGLDAVHQRLSTAILALEAAEPGLVRSNVGAWHSRDDLLHSDDPAFTVLTELFQQSVRTYLDEAAAERPGPLTLALQAWAMVSRGGDYGRPHVHPNTHLALVYYVDAGDADPEGLSGRLDFLDPRNRPEMFALPNQPFRDNAQLRPTTGTMVVFPAWLYHWVHPYQGQRPRIVVACNATVRP